MIRLSIIIQTDILGDGNNDGNGGADNLKVCLDAAKNEIANLGVNYFYTVGVGKASDYVNLSDLCSASGVSGAKNFDGTNTDELTKAFSTIESDILTFYVRMFLFRMY